MLFLLFGLGNARYALDATQIAEVLPRVALKAMPQTPPWVAGLLHHRDNNIPVLDLNALATGTPARERMSTRLVLVFYPAPGPEAHLLGILVEQATETLRCGADEFGDTGLRHDGAPWLGPVRQDERGMIQWIRVSDLLPQAVRAQLFPLVEA